MTRLRYLLNILLVLSAISCGQDTGVQSPGEMIMLQDSSDAEVPLPADVKRIICSGPGCLRYLTYLECQDAVMAVDDMEKRRQQFDARPYALAHPEFKTLPMFGEFRGQDNPELILTLDPLPQVIFKTYAQSGYNPQELHEKTGLPVFVLEYGDLGANRSLFYDSLRRAAQVMKKEARAEAVIAFIDDTIADLARRTQGAGKRKSCYIGGVAYRGPLGLQSTEPAYPPLAFLGANNVAAQPDGQQAIHLNVSREKIIVWDPEIIFIDLATYQGDSKANAFHELKNHPAFRHLRANTSGQVYGVLPYNWYTQNHGSTLANAYFIGKILYPERFADIDPAKKADEIYTFLVGRPVFSEMNESFFGLAFQRLE